MPLPDSLNLLIPSEEPNFLIGIRRSIIVSARNYVSNKFGIGALKALYIVREGDKKDSPPLRRCNYSDLYFLSNSGRALMTSHTNILGKCR